MRVQKILLLGILFLQIVSCDTAQESLLSQVLDKATGGQERILVEINPTESNSYELKGRFSVTIPEGSVATPDRLSVEVKSGEFRHDPKTKIEFLSGSILEISLENQDFFNTPASINIPFSLEEIPEGRFQNETSAFYLRESTWIPVQADVEPDQKFIKINTMHPGEWTWGLVENDEPDELIISWLDSIAESSGAKSNVDELYQQRLSEWETSWEKLTEQINTMVELETPLQIGFDQNLIPVKGLNQKDLNPLMERFGINTGSTVLFIIGAQEIGVVKAVLGSDYIVDYFGDPNQLNESIKSERRAWMRLKEAECVRDSISISGIPGGKPFCPYLLKNYVEELQAAGRIDTHSLDFEVSAITDDYIDELMNIHIQEMAEIEEIFNVEIVDQEISYDETGEKLELPDVTGMTAVNAGKLLESLGFEVEILDGSSEYEPGIIFKQKPEAGVFSDPTITVVKIYRTIDE